MLAPPSRNEEDFLSIGTLRCIAINVTDFEVGDRFWSVVTGWEVLGPAQGLHGRLGYLGPRNPQKHEMILIHTDNAHEWHRCGRRADRAAGGFGQEAAQPLPAPRVLWPRQAGH